MNFLPGSLPLLLTVGLSVCLFTLISTNFGLSILIFSMLLSPEMEAGNLPQRAVTVRVEDILIGVVFFTWLAKMAILKEIGLFRRSNLNRALFAYIVLIIIPTLLAWQAGELEGKGAHFYLLKYIEYFIVFFMFFNNITSKRQIQKFLIFFLITGCCVSLFALSRVGKVPRLGAPFEGEFPEPGSLGGYLLIQIAVLLGLLMHSNWPRHRLALHGLLLLAVLTLVLSTSRGALLAFLPLYSVAIWLTPKRRLQLVVSLLIVCILGYPFIPPRVLAFIREAFSAGEGGKVYRVGVGALEVGPSGAARVEAWKNVLQLWQKRPILGYGVTGVGIVDSQFVRVLGETGMIGFLAFVWLLFLVFQAGFQAYRSEDSLTKGLGMGLILANTGLIVQGFTANSFIIVRIMEPFWFLVAVTLGMTQLSQEEVLKEQKAKVA